MYSLFAVKKSDDQIALLNRQCGLPFDLLLYPTSLLTENSAGIDKGKGKIKALNESVVPIASYTRDIFHDRNPSSNQSIKEGGFSDVRSADNGDGWDRFR